MDTTAINPVCKKCGLSFEPRAGMFTLDNGDGPYHFACVTLSPVTNHPEPTLQERWRKLAAEYQHDADHGYQFDRVLKDGVHVNPSAERSRQSAMRLNEAANALDAAQAEIARLTAKYEPGHTDLMVSPERLDAFLAENPLPEDSAPLPVGDGVVEREKRALEYEFSNISEHVAEEIVDKFNQLGLLRQPEASDFDRDFSTLSARALKRGFILRLEPVNE